MNFSRLSFLSTQIIHISTFGAQNYLFQHFYSKSKFYSNSIIAKSLIFHLAWGCGKIKEFTCNIKSDTAKTHFNSESRGISILKHIKPYSSKNSNCFFFILGFSLLSQFIQYCHYGIIMKYLYSIVFFYFFTKFSENKSL